MKTRCYGVTVAFFFHFHIIDLILRRGMGLVRDAEWGGGGGGGSIFSACVGSRPASTFHPPKYKEFQAPKKYLTRAYV